MVSTIKVNSFQKFQKIFVSNLGYVDVNGENTELHKRQGTFSKIKQFA